MRNKVFVLLLLLGLSPSSQAEEGRILNTLSPKLRQFLSENPKAYQSLTNSLSEAFAKRTLQLYYFYSDDESIARASHYYPNEAAVGIFIRENQQALDEFICLVFEAINSISEKGFLELFAKAESGEISKDNFTREIAKLEFKAAKRTRDLLMGIRPSGSEAFRSYYYKRFKDCPDDFEDFLLYSKKVSSPHRDSTKEWEMKYDLLRKH